MLGWVIFRLTDCFSETLEQGLTWEVHLYPGRVGVCPASAEWVHLRRHRIQTKMRCDWLGLYLYCFSLF